MLTPHSRLRAFAFAAGVAILALGGWASADPPSRVARLGYMTGPVSFSPAGENDWVRATVNRPLTAGDRLWADAGGRAEIQVGGAMMRMSAGTSVSVLNLDDQIAQLQLAQGTLNVRVRRLEPGQMFEVDTPNLAFTLRQPGEYRIEVDPDGGATTIVVRKGQGEVYGEGAAYVIDSRQPYRFTGTGLREYQYIDAPRFDEFDRWSIARDRSYDSSVSARYVSQDVIGYQDLDAYGTWRVDASYGNVWIPSRVAAGWAPYSDGHWAWIDPWGWTWVDDAPWGFAVSHYGRWTNLRGTWGWVPGPMRTRAYYAPALVAFVGGSSLQLAISGGNVGGVAWFPLGPREVYRPSYPVSRGYFENVNRSNTVINTTVVNNYYNNVNVTNVVYANRQVPGAVIAVPAAAFVQSKPVAPAALRVTREVIASAPVAAIPPVAPTERSVRGAAGPGDNPPPRVFERPVVVRSAPPAPSAGFAAQQQQLAAKPGKPLDDAARRELKPAAAASAPIVKVVTPEQKAPPTAPPPRTAPVTKPGDAHGKPEPPEKPAASQPSTTGVPPQRVAPAPPAPLQVAPPASAVQPPDQRGRTEQRGNEKPRSQPVSPPPSPPQRAAPTKSDAPEASPPPLRAAPAKAAAPPVAPPPVVQPPEQRGKAEAGGKAEQPGQPLAPRTAPPQAVPPPAASPQRAAPPQATPPPSTTPAAPQRRAEPKIAPPPQAAPPVPAPQPSPQRARPEPAPAVKQAPPSAPVAAPRPPSAQPQAPPAPKADPRGKTPKPDAAKPDDKKKDGDEQKRDEEARKQKN